MAIESLIIYRALLFAIYHLIYNNGSIKFFFQSFLQESSSNHNNPPPPSTPQSTKNPFFSRSINIITITIIVLCIFRLELGIFNNECHFLFSFYVFMRFVEHILPDE